MRTMFVGGFQGAGQSFWMGQFMGPRMAALGQGSYDVDYNQLKNQLDQTMPQYNSVMTWLNGQINPRDALGGGSDADLFQQLNTAVSNSYTSVTNFYQMMQSGVSIQMTQDQYADLQTFIQDVPSMYMIVKNHGGFGGGAAATPSTPSTTSTLTQAAAAIPALLQKKGAPVAPSTAAKPAAAPVAPPVDNTPYYVAGGLAVGGVLLALVLKK